MKTHDFWYDLPEELIAQTPLERRDGSRLMVLNRETGEIQHKHFYDVIDYLNPGDCLVMNDSRVLPARRIGARPIGGSVELGLLREELTMVDFGISNAERDWLTERGVTVCAPEKLAERMGEKTT